MPCSAPRGVRAAGSVPASTARSRGAGDASLAASLAPQGAIAPVQDQHGPVRPAQVRPRVVLRGPVQPRTDRQSSALPRIDHNGPAQVGISQYSPGQPHTDLPIPPRPVPPRPGPSRPVPAGLSSRQRRAPGATCRDRGSAPAPRAQLQPPVPSPSSQLGLWVPPAEQEQGLGGYARLRASVSPLPNRGTAGGRRGAGPAVGTGLVPVPLPQAWGMPQSCPGPFQAGLGCSCTYKAWPAPSTWPAQ